MGILLLERSRIVLHALQTRNLSVLYGCSHRDGERYFVSRMLQKIEEKYCSY